MQRTIRALTLVTSAACGGSTPSHGVDAVAPDVSHGGDSAAPDAPATGTVHLVVQNQAAVSGLAVSFADPDGIPTMTTMTDASGAASGTIIAGGSVTVIMAANAIYGVLGVQPGDNLVFGPESAYVAPTPLGAVAVTFTNAFPTADNYTSTVGCAGSGTAGTAPGVTATLSLTSACLNSANQFDVVVLALRNNAVVGFAGAFGNAPPPVGQTKTATFSSWRTDVDAISVATSNTPPNVGALGIASQAWDGGVDFDQVLLSATASAQPRYGDSTTLGVSVPNEPFTSFFVATELYRLGNRSKSSRILRTTGPLGQTVDLTNDLLPFIHDVVVTFPSTRGAPQFEWMTDAPFTSNLLALVAETGYVNANGVQQVAVYAIPPEAVAPLVMPQLPDALAGVRPNASATSLFAQITSLGGDVWVDRADARAHWGRTVLTQNYYAAIAPGGTLLVGYANQ